MNSAQRRTLAAIFAEPVSGTIPWSAVESLFVAVGCKVVEGKGSAVRFQLRGVIGFFHRPHPSKEAKKYQIRNAREFLTKIGAEP
ncbi:MAG: type II toxin-antitoxin system HicA family toxin [Mesorhizobium sp.]|nr:type II toxin-antitoxin system HicA family toxin [Mesorhizobium sp.]MCO5159689.1 type II toxin-antitoxin system HicA family toxin [Mesorhizobium sp.]